MIDTGHSTKSEYFMDPTQRQMLDFEQSWYALGGGSSREISSQFGLSDRDFFTQVQHLLNAEPPVTLSKGQLARMREVVRSRIWMAR